MKKITTLLLFSIAITSALHAQKVYFRAGLGYALPVATEVIGVNAMRTQDYSGNNNTNIITQKSVSASYGAGMNFNLAGGYMFNENIGMEVNVQYTQGKKFETTDKGTYLSNSINGSSDETTKTFSQAIYINPSFILTTGMGPRVPYGRFGVIVGSPKVKEEYTYYADLDGISAGHQKSEYNKGMSFGFQGAVGMNWMLSDKIDLFTEINFISMTYYAKEWNLTESVNNGNDNLVNYPTMYKKTLYKKETTVGNPVDQNQPTEALREARAFSSLSLQIGIVYRLGGHGGS